MWRTRVMDELRALCATNGFFTRQEARDCGYRGSAIDAAVRTGVWRRFRRGFYTFEDLWAAMDDVERHRIRCLAVMRSLGPKVALSHVSAAVMHGVDIWGIDLSRVHVTRLDGAAGRSEGDVLHHEGFCVKDDLVTRDGLLLVKPERAAIEAVTHSSPEVAQAHFDSTLHHELCDQPALMRQFELMCRWPYTQHLRLPATLADGRSASIGESRGRTFCRRHRIPMPELQQPVLDADGTLLGTTDWYWPGLGYGEFDGKLKYGRLLRPGQSPGEVVFAEKQREDLIREATRLPMIRVIWSDYDRPKVLAARFRRVLGLPD